MTFAQLNAQMSFFIRPLVNFKADVSSSKGLGFSDYVMDVSNYYKYDNIAIHPLFNGLDIGVAAGIVSKSGKYIFEIGLNGDETQSGYIMHVIKTNENDLSFYQSELSDISGRAFPKIIIQNSLRLRKFKNQSNLNLLFGLGYGYKKEHMLGHFNYFSDHAQVDNNTYLEVESDLAVFTLQNYFLHFGLSSELHFKNKYFFDVNVFYSHGFREMSVVSTKVTIHDDLSSKAMNYYSRSKGSGFYLQISRKFQVYPWTKKIKEGI